MNTYSEFLATTYIADRHREAQNRMPGRSRDNSRQVVYRTRSSSVLV